MMSCETRRVRRSAGRVRIGGEESLKPISRVDRPVVLAPVHSGVYAAPLGALITRSFAGRPVMVFAAGGDEPFVVAAARHLRSLGTEIRIVDVINDARSMPAAVKWARRNSALVIAFADLPAGRAPIYGRPATVKVGGQELIIALNHGRLVSALGACLVTCRFTSGLSGDSVTIGTVLATAAEHPIAESDVAAAVTRNLSDLLEATPLQWRMWRRLDEYLDGPPEASTSGSPAIRAMRRRAHRRRSDHVATIRQSTTNDCGLACVSMIVESLAPTREAADRAISADRFPAGMSLSDVRRELMAAGIPCDVMASERIRDILELTVPMILHLKSGGGHYVVLDRAARGRFLIHDPALGRRWVTRRFLQSTASGYAIVPREGSRAAINALPMDSAGRRPSAEPRSPVSHLAAVGGRRRSDGSEGTTQEA